MDLPSSANVGIFWFVCVCVVLRNGFPGGLQQGRPSRRRCRQEGLVDSAQERALVADVARQLGEETASIGAASELPAVLDYGNQPEGALYGEGHDYPCFSIYNVLRHQTSRFPWERGNLAFRTSNHGSHISHVETWSSQSVSKESQTSLFQSRPQKSHPPLLERIKPMHVRLPMGNVRFRISSAKVEPVCTYMNLGGNVI